MKKIIILLERLRMGLRLLGSRRASREAAAWLKNDHPGRLRANYDTRNDLRRLLLSDRAYLEVFWKDLPLGRGPSLSLMIEDEEILRFDCFGPGKGHMHAAYFLPGKGESRLLLPETSIEAQVDRAVFELTRNLRFYQARMANIAVRRMALNEQMLEKTVGEARELMLSFVRDVDALATGAA